MPKIQELADNLMTAFHDFHEAVQRQDKHLYERWKAGGFLVSDNIASMYPNAQEVADNLEEDEEECQHPNAVESDHNPPATWHCPDCGINFIYEEE